MISNAERIEESLNQEMNFVKTIAAQHNKSWRREGRDSRKYESIRVVPKLPIDAKEYLAVSVLGGSKNRENRSKSSVLVSNSPNDNNWKMRNTKQDLFNFKDE